MRDCERTTDLNVKDRRPFLHPYATVVFTKPQLAFLYRRYFCRLEGKTPLGIVTGNTQEIETGFSKYSFCCWKLDVGCIA